MIDIKKIAKTIILQDRVNKEILGKDWINTIDPRRWIAAVIDESAELLKSEGYEWWKKTNVDRNNSLIEIVDMLHFINSFFISLAGDPQILASTIEDSEVSYNEIKTLEEVIEEVSKIPNVLLRSRLGFLNPVSGYLETISSLFSILKFLNFDENDMFKKFFEKVILNIHRTRNGYKEGKYVKVLNGLEDNEWLLNSIKQDLTQLEIDEALDIIQKAYDLKIK